MLRQRVELGVLRARGLCTLRQQLLGRQTLVSWRWLRAESASSNRSSRSTRRAVAELVQPCQLRRWLGSVGGPATPSASPQVEQAQARQVVQPGH